MNNSEAVVLCRYVKAICPQQAIDEYTPDAWGDLLPDISLADARDAVRELGRRQPFIAPAEIVAETKRIRGRRIANAPHPVPPPGLDPIETAEWLRAAWKRIGDGEALPDDQRGELEDRDMAHVLASAAPKSVNR